MHSLFYIYYKLFLFTLNFQTIISRHIKSVHNSSRLHLCKLYQQWHLVWILEWKLLKVETELIFNRESNIVWRKGRGENLIYGLKDIRDWLMRKTVEWCSYVCMLQKYQVIMSLLMILIPCSLASFPLKAQNDNFLCAIYHMWWHLHSF